MFWREYPARSEAGLPGKPLVELHPAAVINNFVATETGNEKLALMRQMWSILDQRDALAQGLPYHLQLSQIEFPDRLLQVTHTAMRQLGRCTGTSGSEISSIDEHG